MLATLLLLPPIAAALCLAKIPDRARLFILRAAAFTHLALTFALWLRPAAGPSASYLSLDAVGLLVLSPTSALFAGVSVYLGGYLARASDPPPGNTVMWRGLSRLTDIALGAMVGAEIVGN